MSFTNTEMDLSKVNFNKEELQHKVRDFSDLLKQIKEMDDKKAQLWLEIYENAITDRQLAYLMFAKLAIIVGNSSTDHAVHSRAMVMYIERMSKANDQLIKLGEIVSSTDKPKTVSSDDMFKRIKGG